MIVEYFRSLERTNRFKKNQKVWIRCNHANHLTIYYRHRGGKNRYVEGVIDKSHKSVGKIVRIDVDEKFAKRIHGRFY